MKRDFSRARIDSERAFVPVLDEVADLLSRRGVRIHCTHLKNTHGQVHQVFPDLGCIRRVEKDRSTVPDLEKADGDSCCRGARTL